jgi:dTMP kinase
MSHDTSGLLITFEGIDGSGKSTQLGLLADWFRQAFPERPIVETRNPGGTGLGQQIRRLLLEVGATGEEPIDPTSELLLYMADRAQHVGQVIAPALAQGGVVLCDRFTDSTLAYQGFGRGLDHSRIQTLNEIATGGRLPDVTFVFDAAPEALAERVRHRGEPDRIEREAQAFHARVRAGFLAIAQSQPERVCVIDALLPRETQAEQVLQFIRAKLSVPAA